MEPNEAVIKTSRAAYIFPSMMTTMLLTIYIFNIRKLLIISVPGTVLAALALLCLNIPCWYRMLISRVAIVINDDGIHYRKGLLRWWDIRSFQTIDEDSGDGSSLLFIITFWNGNPDLTIDLTDLITDSDQIRAHISTFTDNPKIVDKGHIHKR